MRAKAPIILAILATLFAARALFLATTELDSAYYLSFSGFLVLGGLLLALAAFLTNQRAPHTVPVFTLVLATASTVFLGVTAISLDFLASSASGPVRWLAIMIQSVSGTFGCGFAALTVCSAWRGGLDVSPRHDGRNGLDHFP